MKLTKTPAEFLFSKNLWELFARASEPAQFAGRAPRLAGHWQESVWRADGLPLLDPRWARLAGPDPWELECDLWGLGYLCSRSKTEQYIKVPNRVASPVKKTGKWNHLLRIVGACVPSLWAAEFSEGLLKASLFIGGQKKLNTVSQVTETPKMTPLKVGRPCNLKVRYLWNGCGSRQAAVVV